jgi:excisionase family DNA binding protein
MVHSELLSFAQVAELVGVSQSTVRGWVKSGELRAVNVGQTLHSQKPRFRILRCDLDEFLENRRIGLAPRTRKTSRLPPDIPRYV